MHDFLLFVMKIRVFLEFFGLRVMAFFSLSEILVEELILISVITLFLSEVGLIFLLF